MSCAYRLRQCPTSVTNVQSIIQGCYSLPPLPGRRPEDQLTHLQFLPCGLELLRLGLQPLRALAVCPRPRIKLLLLHFKGRALRSCRRLCLCQRPLALLQTLRQFVQICLPLLKAARLLVDSLEANEGCIGLAQGLHTCTCTGSVGCATRRLNLAGKRTCGTHAPVPGDASGPRPAPAAPGLHGVEWLPHPPKSARQSAASTTRKVMQVAHKARVAPHIHNHISMYARSADRHLSARTHLPLLGLPLRVRFQLLPRRRQLPLQHRHLGAHARQLAVQRRHTRGRGTLALHRLGRHQHDMLHVSKAVLQCGIVYRNV